MRTSIIPILFSLFLIPGLASAASVDTDNFTVDVTEVNGKLEFSVELKAPAPSEPEDSTETAEPEATVEISVEPPTTEDIVSVIGPELQSATLGDVLINEFVSDPVSGEEEWIELYNTTSQTVNLTEWFLMDGSGKKTMLEGSLDANSYAVIYSPKGVLNNGGDTIELFDAFAAQIDHVAYGNWDSATAPSVSDPDSAGRHPDQEDIFVAMTPTPGAMNIVEAEVEIATNEPSSNSDTTTNNSETQNTNEPADTTGAGTNAPTTCTPAESNSAESTNSSETQFIELANVRSLPLESQLVTEGVVSAVPGALGKQVFYLAGSGIQVYLHSSEFPQLERGTRVRVEGELRESSGESRVKLADASGIQIMSTEDAPTPHDVTTNEIGEATEGWLVRLTGMVSERSSDDFYLEDDNGTARIYIKGSTGIANTAALGDEITVTGIVSQTSSGYRILPRDQADILPRVSSEESQDLLAIGSTSSNTPSSIAGWAISTAVVLGLATAGAVHVQKKKTKWNKSPQTA